MFSWFRRKQPVVPSAAPVTPPGWSRIAVGDLLVDMALPSNFNRDYEENGALIVWDDANLFELRVSGLTVTAKDSTAKNLCGESVEKDAAKDGRQAVRISETIGYYTYSKPSTWDSGPACNDYWLVGFGNRRFIVTLAYLEANRARLGVSAHHDIVVAAIRTLALNYPGDSRSENEIKIYNLAESQKGWLEHYRRELAHRVQRETGYDSDQPIPLEVLDEYWGRFIATPPESNDTLNAILNGVGVAFGDHLVGTRKFEWVIRADSYGVGLAVVALRGTANLNSDPFNFVTKRWDRKETPFLAAGVKSISDLADEWAAKEGHGSE